MGAIKTLPDMEEQLFQHTLLLNQRGVPIDMHSVNNVIKFVDLRKEELQKQCLELTDNEIGSTSQVAKVKGWLSKKGLDLDDLRVGTVKDALKMPDVPKQVVEALRAVGAMDLDAFNKITGLGAGSVEMPNPELLKKFKTWAIKHGAPFKDDDVPLLTTYNMTKESRSMLRLRQEMSLSSVAKFRAMKKFTCIDNRTRGALRYHAAATGRFGGAGIQSQNMPSKDVFKGELLQIAHDIIEAGDYEEFKLWFGDDFGKALKSCVRGMIRTTEDNVFISSDYSSVEAVGLAWVAGEQYVLDEFSKGRCLYRVAGAKMYNKPYEDVKKGTVERDNGKISVLACGYQGAVGALKAFNSEIEDEFAKKIVADWREANPKCVEFWSAMDFCSKNAVKTGRVQKYRDITWLTSGDFLLCRLPSGRHLHYYKPFLKKKMMPWGKENMLLHFWGMKSKSWAGKVGQKKWQVCETYGGKLTENIVQALCRDLLGFAIINLEKHGYPIVLHVHDEVVAELPKGTNKSVDNLEKLMGELPPWAEGFPLRASGGWMGRRFRK